MNKDIFCLNKSCSIEMMNKAEALRASGQDIINLAGGEPCFPTPKRICKVAMDSMWEGNTHYAVGPGLPQLRERVAVKLKNENRITINPNQIIMTPGGKYGIYLAMRALLNAGDEVIVFDPSWVSYKPIAQACGATVKRIELNSKDNYALHEEQISACISDRTRLIVVNYPNNPTGRILRGRDAECLRNILNSNNVYLLSDEVYEKIVYDSMRSVSPGSWEEVSQKVITVNSLSKSIAMTGWRVGYVVAEQELIDTMYKLYTHTITGLSPFIQLAAVEAFGCQREMADMLKGYTERRSMFISGINKTNKFECLWPEGAFYAWVKVKNGEPSDIITEQLLDRVGIIGVSGKAYGVTAESFIRFSFATDEVELQKALERLQEFDLY